MAKKRINAPREYGKTPREQVLQFLRQYPPFPARQQRRLDALLDKQETEGLTRTEKAELRKLVKSATQTSISMLRQAVAVKQAAESRRAPKPHAVGLTRISA